MADWKITAATIYCEDIDDEVTVIDFGPSADDKYPTAYFRHTFDVSNPSRFERLYMRLLVDDGAAPLPLRPLFGISATGRFLPQQR